MEEMSVETEGRMKTEGELEEEMEEMSVETEGGERGRRLREEEE